MKKINLIILSSGWELRRRWRRDGEVRTLAELLAG